jgi:H+/Cl- antiporter ClcA
LCFSSSRLLRLLRLLRLSVSPSPLSSLLSPLSSLQVLFSIEVTSNVYETSNYWKGFFCASMGAMTFTYLSKIDSATGNVVSLFWTEFKPLPYLTWEMILYLLLAICCGALGGLFTKLVRSVLHWKKQARTAVAERTLVGPLRNAWNKVLTNEWVFTAVVVTVTGITQYSTGTFMYVNRLNGVS